jgi:pilus assembly protein Flp/PilA
LSTEDRVAHHVSISRFFADERGATAIEYGLICAMIAMVVIAIAGVGGGLTMTYDKLKDIISALGGGSNNGG